MSRCDEQRLTVAVATQRSSTHGTPSHGRDGAFCRKPCTAIVPREGENHSPPYESRSGPAEGRATDQSRYSRPRSSADRRRRSKPGRHRHCRSSARRRGSGSRSRGDRAERQSAPVCKILDYGKHRFTEQKKQAEARKRQKVVEVKEIKLRPGIDEHDYDVKMRAVRRFFDEGDKVKVTLRFRGREMAHQDIGYRLLDRVKTETDERSPRSRRSRRWKAGRWSWSCRRSSVPCRRLTSAATRSLRSPGTRILTYPALASTSSCQSH